MKTFKYATPRVATFRRRTWAGVRVSAVLVVGETKSRFRIQTAPNRVSTTLSGGHHAIDARSIAGEETALVPRTAITFEGTLS